MRSLATAGLAVLLVLTLASVASALTASDTLTLTVYKSTIIHIDDKGPSYYAQGDFLQINSTRTNAFNMGGLRVGSILVTNGKVGTGSVFLPDTETVYYYDAAKRYYVQGPYGTSVPYDCLSDLCQDTLTFRADRTQQQLVMSGKPDGYVFTSTFMELSSSRRAFSFADAVVDRVSISMDNGESTQSGAAPRLGDFYYYVNPTVTGAKPSDPRYKLAGTTYLAYYRDSPAPGQTSDQNSCTYYDRILPHGECQNDVSGTDRQALYCQNATLKRACAICGCPSYAGCATDGACYSLTSGARLSTFPDLGTEPPVPSAYVTATPYPSATYTPGPEPSSVIITSSPTPYVGCRSNSDCDDYNPCTTDSCTVYNGNFGSECAHSNPRGCVLNNECVESGTQAYVYGVVQVCSGTRFVPAEVSATPEPELPHANTGFFLTDWLLDWLNALNRAFFG